MRGLLKAVFLAMMCVGLSLVPSCGGDDNDDSASSDDDAINDDVADDDAVDDDAVDDDAVDDDSSDDDSTDDDTADDDTADDDTPFYPNDDFLRVNMLQAKGSHNSYHIQPDHVTIPEYRYTHFPLDQELASGVRQVELDIHYNADGIRVFHVPIIDPLTTCELFTECLTIIKDWSEAHPGHQLLMIFVEPKDDIDLIKWPGHQDAIESEILSVWPRESILTPDEVRGDYATLRDAVLTAGWPTMGQARNRVMFHINDSGDFRDAYLGDFPDLEGALAFIDSAPADNWAAVLVLNDPEPDEAAIIEGVNDGFIVRTRADSCCAEAINSDYTRFDIALASGAHFISTDFPILGDQYDYVINIPGGTPSRCNPLTAPEFCAAADIESLQTAKDLAQQSRNQIF